MDHVSHLVPPLFKQGAMEHFRKSGETVSIALSPRDNTIAVYASLNVRMDLGCLCMHCADGPTQIDPQVTRDSPPKERQIYFASAQEAPLSERRVVSPCHLWILPTIHILVHVVRDGYFRHFRRRTEPTEGGARAECGAVSPSLSLIALSP